MFGFNAGKMLSFVLSFALVIVIEVVMSGPWLAAKPLLTLLLTLFQQGVGGENWTGKTDRSSWVKIKTVQLVKERRKKK